MTRRKKLRQQHTPRQGQSRVSKRGAPAPRSQSKSAGQQAAPRKPTHGDSFPIVGIGASAGGLETFGELLSKIPVNTGMGFVYVQHLDPHHESMLSALLARHTAMPVREAADGMAVKPNHVYVMPPRTELAMRDGRIALHARPQSREPHMSIDYFLRSLAADQRNGAIGVILSGTASDGTLGLQAIKDEGGLTIVQDPHTAKYDGMPRSAVAAGVADLVLPLDQIARELVRVGRHPYLSLAPATEASTADAQREDQAPVNEKEPELAEIFRMLRRNSGVDFSHYKPATIKRRIARRMAIDKKDDIALYLAHLKSSPAEVSALYQDLLINVTSFFRDTDTSAALQDVVLPRLFKDRSGDTAFRAWVPGCASGEEAYSLAIMVLEQLGDTTGGIPIQIFATDVNDAALERARRGVYSQDTLSAVSPERLRRFFTKADGGYRVKKILRDLCLFAHHDIGKDPPFSRLDLISCRNVLIYLGASLQQRIIPMFHYALNPRGVLVLGHSETIGSFAGQFSLIDKKNKIYGKKHLGRPTSRGALPNVTVPLLPVSISPLLPTISRAAAAERNAPDVRTEADRLALERYAPPGVLVNDSLDVVQFRGSTSEFLEPPTGEATHNLLKMARGYLAVELRKVIHQARRRNAAVRSDAIRFKGRGARRGVTIEVTPLNSTGVRERHLMVTFDVGVRAAARADRIPRAPRGTAEAERITELEQELTANREYLKSTVEAQEATNEELRSAVEEIQSSNEELQSVNEELETAKEELQSSNEELTTVNEELQTRNAELGQVNNDLVNLLYSISIAVVILDENLRIRRFTPVAEKMLNLIEADVGRPVGDLRMSVMIPDLQKRIHTVLHTLAVDESELQDETGRWLSLRIRPYRTLDNKINGAVLTLTDINDIKRGMLEAEEARDYAQAVVATLREPLIVLDDRLRVVMINPAYRRQFGVTSIQTEGCSLFELEDGQWNIPKLRELLRAILQTSTPFENFELEAEFRTGRRHLILNAARIERRSGPALILLAMEDVPVGAPRSNVRGVTE